MRRLIGEAIDTVCRRAARAMLDLRLPAARIRQHDLYEEREKVANQIRALVEETNHLVGELTHIEKEIADQRVIMALMQERSDRLRTPAPTQPMEDL